MQRSYAHGIALLGVLALVICGGSGCTIGSAAGGQRSRPPTATPTVQTIRYMSTLHPVNDSGVSGSVQLDMTGSRLTVTIHASGLELNQIHMQHIHGYGGLTVICPAPASTNGEITVEQGVAAVGPIALDLQPYAQVSASGSIDWSQTYMLAPGVLSDVMPLTGHVVVLHGMTFHGTYVSAMFVACGAIQAA
jgi:hypothetical protein